MADSVIRTGVDHVESGAWTFTNSVVLPSNTVDESALKSAARLPADNLVARFAKSVEQKTGTAIVTETRLVHIAKYAGKLDSVEAAIAAAITGDNTVVIDVQKSTSGGAFATILTSTLTIDSSTVVRTATAATVDATKDDYVAGDIFEVIVTAAGTGTQAQGLNITLFFEENAAT
jgi:hypothetical protein